MYSCLARAQEKECNCTEGKFRTVSGICSETSDGNAMSIFKFTMGPKSRDGEQGCSSSESTSLPPIWPRFESGPGYMWVEFVVSSRLAQRVFLWVSGFPSSTKTQDKNQQYILIPPGQRDCMETS